MKHKIYTFAISFKLGIMDEIKTQIIQLSGKLFTQYGIRSVSIDDVCKKLGISKKTFYVYFKQKEDLVSAVLTAHTEEDIRKLNKHINNSNAIDNLLIFLHHIKTMMQNQKRHPALIYDLQKYYSSVLEQNKGLYEQELNKVFAQNLHKGIAEGLYRDDINIDMLCVFFCSRHTTVIVSTIVKSANNENSQSVLDFFIEMLAHYIMTPQGWIYLQKNSLLQTYNRARRAFKVDKQKKKQKNNR